MTRSLSHTHLRVETLLDVACTVVKVLRPCKGGWRGLARLQREEWRKTDLRRTTIHTVYYNTLLQSYYKCQHNDRIRHLTKLGRNWLQIHRNSEVFLGRRQRIREALKFAPIISCFPGSESP